MKYNSAASRSKIWVPNKKYLLYPMDSSSSESEDSNDLAPILGSEFRRASKPQKRKMESPSTSSTESTDIETELGHRKNQIGFTARNSFSLFLLTVSFVVGEISHFLVGVVSQEMARSLHYGEQVCNVQQINISNRSQSLGRTNAECEKFTIESCHTHQGCELLETGQGMEYQVLAGPTFVVVFTLSGILMGYLADKTSRPRLLSLAVILFSVCGGLMGFAQDYWHLLILRMGIAAGEAACRPASGSLIAEMFDSSTRGMANGIFSWGTYIGNGLTFVLGNYLPWRIAFLAGCTPGLLSAAFLWFLSDPRNLKAKSSQNQKTPPKRSEKQYFNTVLASLMQPAMLLLFAAAAVRHTAGYAWIYNCQNYFNEYFPEYDVGMWLTSCSIFGGGLGVFFGGWISDSLVARFGLHSRLWLLSVATVMAAPCAAGVLSTQPPTAFGFLMAYYFLAETWFAILFTVLVEIVAAEVRSVCIAVFLFMMNNVGGNLPVIVAPIAEIHTLRWALYIIWAGFVAASGVLFFIASLPLWKMQRKQSESEK